MKTETPAIDPAQVRRVLVTKLRHHGDVLLTTPVLRSLKRQLPWAEVDMLVYAECADLLADNPDLSQLHLIRKTRAAGGSWGKFKQEWALARTLKSRRYDLVLHLTDHNRGASLVRWLKPRWSVGQDGPWRGIYKRSFTHLYQMRWGNTRHTVEMNLDALRMIGLYPTDADKLLRLVPGTQATGRIAQRLAAAGLAPRTYLLVHPGSRWAYKTWPAERMARAVAALRTQGWPIVLTGAPDAAERSYADALLAALPSREGVIDWVGQLNLRELAAAIDSARLMLGVDSVPMHMAAALGTPVVALFGPSGQTEWGPWQVPHRIVDAGWPCIPCGFKGCGQSGYSDCLANLPEAKVLAALDDLLAETGGR